MIAKDYRSYRFWLDTCGDELTPRPPLDGSMELDVAILGAGLSRPVAPPRSGVSAAERLQGMEG